MILLIDIGNSRIKIGLCKNPLDKNSIDIFYCNKIENIDSILTKVGIHEFESVLISSVVPELNNVIINIIKKLKLNKNDYIIIGTGGFAEIINNQIGIFDSIDQNLTLDGMRIIYNLNKK